MIGILIVAAISWGLIWAFTRKSILVLGFQPTTQRMNLFLLGFVAMAVGSATNHLMQAWWHEIVYVQNVNYGLMEAWEGTFWTFKAAVLEELVFRGALLYLLIRWLGEIKACLISAAAFGIYHWFSYELLGGPYIRLAYVFLLTGAAGWMFSFAFARSKSILVPLGMHFGWIIVSIVVFSAGPMGEQWLLPQGEGVELKVWQELAKFLFQTLLVPGLATWYIIKKFPKQAKSVD